MKTQTPNKHKNVTLYFEEKNSADFSKNPFSSLGSGTLSSELSFLSDPPSRVDFKRPTRASRRSITFFTKSLVESSCVFIFFTSDEAAFLKPFNTTFECLLMHFNHPCGKSTKTHLSHQSAPGSIRKCKAPPENRNPLWMRRNNTFASPYDARFRRCLWCRTHLRKTYPYQTLG